MEQTEQKFTNHLIGESSPYLLQHAHNPVNWYPWGAEALERAKREDKPIFLSIGYSSCHWCHVMERESFENEAIANVLNEHFVSIKVDREQRPDLDHIYMSFTTALTGQGGWPMTVFLTPDLKPFFAGTYFPPDDRYGRPGFMKVISEIAGAYKEEKASIVESSQDIFDQVASRLQASPSPTLLSKEVVKRSAAALMQGFDHTYGGFGQAPKFPHAPEISFFLRYYKSSGDLSYLQAAEKALSSMAQGGIYDQLGGGFARYSTDQRWLVPHFEKMLYDNALLVKAYADAFQSTGKEMYREIIGGTLDFVLREMTNKEGGFYCALDADSGGVEGEFYVWSKQEIDNILGADASLFEEYYDVTAGGNFEGKNILHLTGASERVYQTQGDSFKEKLSGMKSKLLEVRTRRVRPGTDDKILTSWNGLMLGAMARGYQVTFDKKYLDAAIRNAEFIERTLCDRGTLKHSYREGRHSDGEFLEDYAFLISGLLDLYESDSSDKNMRWLSLARELADRACDLFLDDEGRFFLRPANESDLILRPSEDTDSAIPAPGSVMISNLLKLNRLTDEKRYVEKAELALRKLSGLMERYPGGMTSALFALEQYLSDKLEIVVVGESEERRKMLGEIHSHFLPYRTLALGSSLNGGLPLFEGRAADAAETRVFVCINSSCRQPVTTAEELRQILRAL